MNAPTKLDKIREGEVQERDVQGARKRDVDTCAGPSGLAICPRMAIKGRKGRIETLEGKMSR